MNKRVVLFGLSAVVSLAGAVAACSSSSTPSPDTSSAEDAGTGKETGTGGGKDSSTPEIDSSTPVDPDKACAAEATLQACGTCCITNHKAGYKVFQDVLLDCTCKGTGADGGVGPCATDCAATACATTPKQPDATCNKCLQAAIQGGACTENVSSTCMASADCVAQQKCVTPCQGKP